MGSELDSTILDDKSFAAIADLAYRESGLQLVAEKTSMIQSRLRSRLKDVGIDDFRTYASYVTSENGVAERKMMISALTTNVSHFFREKHHFDILTDEIFPDLIGSIRAGARARIWSAGCSNGQEAFSIVMSLLEAYPELSELDFKVLATDIDPKVVSFASLACYPERLVGGIPKHLLNRFFTSDNEGGENMYRANEELRSKVSFKELNLLGQWPMKHSMDVIFCRNVVIYFDVETQNALWPRFQSQLTKNGRLFLGHSERIANPQSAGFVSDGPTAYSPSTARKN